MYNSKWNCINLLPYRHRYSHFIEETHSKYNSAIERINSMDYKFVYCICVDDDEFMQIWHMLSVVDVKQFAPLVIR